MTGNINEVLKSGYWYDLQTQINEKKIEELRKTYPEKFADDETIFSHINRGDRIFISTGCGEPQYLVSTLIDYVNSHPKAFFDAEVLHVWTLGVAPLYGPKI